MSERPALRYHGGKWRLAPWVIEHFPAHRVYVEPFGGGASVLLRKPRSYAEVYNDLDGEIVNFFRVLRDKPKELERACRLTPFARAEFDKSFALDHKDPVERARRTAIRSFFGFGGNLTRENRDQSPQRTGFRTYTKREGLRSTPAGDWRNWPDSIAAIAERLRGVVIEDRDAAKVIREHDASDALLYVDPPYVHSTRSYDAGGSHRGYRHELTDEQHVALAMQLRRCHGAVVVSGYPSTLYDRLYEGWTRKQRSHLADGARRRLEVLWINDACVTALDRSVQQLPLEKIGGGALT